MLRPHNSKAHYYLHEVNELRKKKPCPLESMSNALITASTVFFQGHRAKANFHKEVYEIGKKRVDKHIPRPYEEKFRVVFPYMSMFFDLSFYEWMDRELGMVEVIDPFNLYFYLEHGPYGKKFHNPERKERMFRQRRFLNESHFERNDKLSWNYRQ